MLCPAISVVITAHNEGDELLRTIESVRSNTRQLCEIVLVDDGSTDGSCERIESTGVKVIRHQRRIGVAYSRHEAVRQTTGNVLCFLDAHQRVTKGCIDECARIALADDAIVSPQLRGLSNTSEPLYGSTFRLCPKNGFFSATWVLDRPSERITKFSALRGPGYVIPRNLYDDVAWSGLLRGWGGSEASIGLKAFFLGVDILYLRDVAAYHLFRRTFPYKTSWDEIWRNQALIARVCFDDRTWYKYWLPALFEKHLSTQARRDLESDELLAEHEAFQAKKIRLDSEFWTDLLHVEPPQCVRRVRRSSGSRVGK